MPFQLEYAKQYWQLGNLIAGFSALQVLATLFAFASNPPFRDALSKLNYLILVIIVIFFHLVYGLAIWRCYRMEIRLIPPTEPQILSDRRYFLFGRLATIVLFAVLLLFIFYPWTGYNRS